MKSNVCKIEKGSHDLAAILKESGKVAVYNELDHKQSLQLRLICEELDGMLPELIEDFEGDFWIEFEDGVCKINASIKIAEIDSPKKEKLLKIAKNEKNAAATGIAGKIRSAIEDFFLSEGVTQPYIASIGSFHLATGYNEGVYYSYLWSLEQYKDVVKKDEKAEAWDELEKSVIASVADDIIIGVKGKQADIIIVKKFA